MYYYLIVAIQGFCIYHCYKKRNETFWYFIIFFIPLIGSVVYLLTQVYNKKDIEVIQNEIVTIINPTKKVKDLKAKVDFADTSQNRINLGDAYFEINDYSHALENYKIALKDSYGNNYHTIGQIIECYDSLKDYNNVIEYTEKIKKHNDFKKSRLQFIYGIALYNIGKLEQAEEELIQVNQRYSNYEERLLLVKFLNERGKV